LSAPVGSKEYWQVIADIAQKQPRIYAGLEVTVTGGRKHKGKTGKVTRHERSRYGFPFRYVTGASLDLMILEGRRGFRALVQPLEGPSFWIDCDHLMPAVQP
jgi:hypothetical protein